MRRSKTLFLNMAVPALLLVTANSSHAQTSGQFAAIRSNTSAADILAYWTPERIASAQPAPMPVAPFGTGDVSVPENMLSAPSPDFQAPGQPPRLQITPKWRVIGIPAEAAEIAPSAAGTSGLRYISTRLIPQTADVEYPYRAAGKLFYQSGRQNFSCTASMIRRRVLLTAGHCVNDGKGTTFQNFMFVPSFRNGMMPFQAWNWSGIGFVPVDWLTGGGGMPNPADYAVLVMADQGLNGVVAAVDDVVGTLGFATRSLAPNELVILGYPCNLDAGRLMHQVNSGQSSVPFFGNIALYGDDMQQGSSGGPWIQDFGIAATGQVAGGTNQVVGVASFGRDAPPPGQGCTTNPIRRQLGASIFDIRFKNIVVAACSAAPGNC